MLNQLKWKFQKFMYGRYGVDQLYIAGGLLFLVLQILQIFMEIPLLNLLLVIFILWLFFRVFSKNTVARQTENQKFLKFSQSVQSKGQNLIQRFRDISTHRYRKCPECETTLRLPRKKGTHKTRCPRCNHSFKVKIWV